MNEALPRRRFLHDAESSQIVNAIGEWHGPMTFIVGAGASVEAGLPSWGELINDLIRKNLPKSIAATGSNQKNSKLQREWQDAAISSGLPAAAAIAEHASRRKNFGLQIYRGLYRDARSANFVPGALAQQLACWSYRFGSDVRIATVNYDDLIEKALGRLGLEPVPVYDEQSFETHSDNAQAIFHLHGLLNDAHKSGPVVLTEDDYGKFQSGQTWQDEFISARLHDSMCVFVGLSFTDPNLIRWIHSADDFTAPHLALFSRQSSPDLSLSVRNELERATRKRWSNAGLTAYFTDFFGEQTQILHEASILRGGEDLPEFETRAALAHENASSFFGMSEDFQYRQIEASKWLRTVLEEVRKIVKSVHSGTVNESWALGLWVSNHPAGNLTMLGTSDRAHMDKTSLMPVALELESKWAAVEAVTTGSPRVQDPDTYASRWRYVRALPIIVGSELAGRTLVGAATLTSTRPQKDSVFGTLPRLALDQIDSFILESVRWPFELGDQE